MEETLKDIRDKLANGVYQNEEHVRLSLVARILQYLGWNIWDPVEVKSEFVPNPSEDATKVDIALALNKYEHPSVFIEIKAVGKITNLNLVETQLRDYNRNHTAPITILTDGNLWRFYLSNFVGQFGDKCFKVLRLDTDDLELLEESFTYFLSRVAIADGSAEKLAREHLSRSSMQRAMADNLIRARKMVTEPPYPSLPEALVSAVRMAGINITREEAVEFLSKNGSDPQPVPTPVPDPFPRPSPKPTPSTLPEPTQGTTRLTFKSKSLSAVAELYSPSKKMKVLAGSEANYHAGKIEKKIIELRRQLVREGVLSVNGNHYLFTRDYLFNSANQASQVIAGTSINARINWLNKNGRSISDLGLPT